MADSAEQAGVAVSVIVTCFNQERWIAAAVQSVLQQTLAGLECIVVDDGSADGSAAVVQRLQQQDSRIRLVRQSNQGVSAARNAGFQLARGSLIQFLD
ncbi:MAG: glycosyltransferase family 2 protein, partial [Planctomyces sp.]